MSVIAWDGSSLAADRASFTGDGMRMKSTSKLRRLDDSVKGPIVIGFCGPDAFIMDALEAIKGFGPWPEPGQFGLDRAGVIAIAVMRKRRHAFFITAGGHWMRITERRWAIGAGKEIAVGALAAGASARVAVKIALKYSDHAGFGVDNMDTRW